MGAHLSRSKLARHDVEPFVCLLCSWIHFILESQVVPLNQSSVKERVPALHL